MSNKAEATWHPHDAPTPAMIKGLRIPEPIVPPIPTDEQRAAWRDAKDYAPDAADILAPLLPSELTNPQPELPTEPGWYLAHDKLTKRDFPVERKNDAFWFNHSGANPHKLGNPERFAPFRRLVPERPQVTEIDVYSAVRAVGGSLSAVTLAAIMHVVKGGTR